MRWQVREAGTGDADRLALIGSTTFLETFAGVLDGSAILEHCRKEHGASAYSATLAAGASSWLAETEPGRAPIGFALMASSSLPGTDPDGQDLELKRIYCLSRFHGSGVGKALLREAVHRARQLQARRLLLGVYAGNERAIAFYRKQGFAPIAKRLFKVGDRDYDDIVFAMPIA
jgi:ribosomal protein S18 acetylase RimI-like enzyme